VATLKLGPLVDDRSTKVTVELPAAILRDLQTYGALLAKASGEPAAIEPAKLIPAMVERFMAADRGFSKAKKSPAQTPGSASE
jgi:hypothetical protein